MNDWLAYTGTGRLEHAERSRRLPDPPPWRTFRRSESSDGGWRERANSYEIDGPEADLINAALYLRRPLLVTGEPGTGKSSLAYSVATELGLGRVLRWPIGSKTMLRDGLYQYDAIGRLQEANLRDIEARAGGELPGPVDVGAYIRLGPLGTALLPTGMPRVLLVDEFDKSDIDLPNDLLDVFEEGEYGIPELERLPSGHPPVTVTTADGEHVGIDQGRVRSQTEAFPLVIITSNGEREFPPAFLRRCLRLHLQPAHPDKLARIVAAHLGTEARDVSDDLIRVFLNRRDQGDLATDQLLNAIYLRFSGLRPAGETPEELAEAVMPYLNRPTE